MRILTVLTYYRPHTSGLTIYAERLARALAARGHEVTVFTSQYEPQLLAEDFCDGVRVIRFPVAFRVSKGVISPNFGPMVNKLVAEHDVVQLHLPQFDAPGVAFRGHLLRKPTVLTYHCDLHMPPGVFNWVVNQVVHTMDHIAARCSDRIVTYTQDYADNSPYLSSYQKKLQIIPPPVVLPQVDDSAVKQFAMDQDVRDCHPVIGMAARLATEKGVEILLDALPQILEKYPKAKVLFAGQYENVFSEGHYYDRLMPTILKYEASGNWKFVGILKPEQMAAFYPNLDVLVVPSLNSTEAFGLVQIEAMMNGVPCVASSLPGVRQPIKLTGMGEVVPIGDSPALADAILKIFSNPEKFKGNPPEIIRRYDPDTIAAEYEKMFNLLLAEKRRK